jgi:hypothetical protein
MERQLSYADRKRVAEFKRCIRFLSAAECRVLLVEMFKDVLLRQVEAERQLLLAELSRDEMFGQQDN